MASSPPPRPKGEETLAQDGGETPKEQEQAPIDAANGGPAQDNEGEDSSGKTLEIATELFNKGSKSIEEGDFVDAVDCLSRALEIRVAHYGELAPECAMAYYKYGCALLYKAQEEADPLGNVPKNPPTNSEKDRSLKTVGDSEGSKASASNVNESNALGDNEEVVDGTSDKDQEDDNDGSDGDGEELGDADEEDSDLDLAWKMLDVARAIVEKCPEDKIEKVNIFSALGEVSLEREDFGTSLNDYLKALSILEQLVEPDNRRIIELNFRISLVLEVWSKVEEAIPYCEKAITLCKSRLKRLGEEIMPTALQDNNGNIENNSGKNDDVALGKGDADPSVEENEKAVLGGVLSELERKLEDLHHILANPRSMISELIQMAASKSSASAETNLSITGTESRSASMNSSQLGVVSGGFDSPTISTAATATNGRSSVTHLGVVGRGAKRAALNPIGAEPSSRKLSLDTSSDKDDSTISEVVDSAAHDAEAQKK